jgi:HAD superfamily hydrolase (TIGR01509 family)
MPTLFPPGAGVVFDMDGLMLDTESVAKIVWQEAARLAGHDMPDTLFQSMIGHSKQDSAGLLRTAYGAHFDFEKLYAACGVLYEDHIARHGIGLMPGIRELLGDLTARGIPVAVATSTRNPVATQRLEQVGLLPYFPVVVGGNEITHGKPAPDIYLEAVRRLGINAAISFALEDSHAGVRSAHGAGLQVIMVPDLVPPTPEIEALTWRVAKSLNEVRSWFAQSSPQP